MRMEYVTPSFSMSPELLEEIDRAAKAREVSKSAIIREAAKLWLRVNPTVTVESSALEAVG